MLDLALDFLFDFGFDFILEVFFPSRPGKDHLEGLPEGKSFFQHLFPTFPAGVVSLFDLPDESANLPLMASAALKSPARISFFSATSQICTSPDRPGRPPVTASYMRKLCDGGSRVDCQRQEISRPE